MGAQGLCFAIGANTAGVVAAEILRHGKVRRATIGLAGQNVGLPRRLVRHLALGHETGVAVVSTEDGSPAAAAGLRSGDVIVALDDIPVAGIDDLHRLLTAARIGLPARLMVVRGTELLTMEVTPRERRPA
jgi:S1-C subfamily serine protease